MAYAAIALMLAAVPAWSAPEKKEKVDVPVTATKLFSNIVKANKAKEFVPDSNMERKAIPDLYKWDLSSLCKSDAEFYDRLAKVSKERESLSQFKGKLGNPETLRACLEKYLATDLETGYLAMYANLRFTTYQDNNDLQIMSEKAQNEVKALTNDTTFMRQEVLALSDAQVSDGYAKVPALKEYEPWITEVRRRSSRVLSPKEERILALAQDNQFATTDLNELPSGYEKAFGSMYTDIKLPTIKDEKGKEVQLTFTNYSKYRGSNDRRVRRETVEKFFGTLNDYRHVFASLMAGQIEYTVFLARSRGYDSALEAYLDRDNIPTDVYRNVVNSVRANLKPLHRYVQLRKKIMGIDDLHIYDLYPPMVAGVNKDIPYNQAIKTIPKALQCLGPDYIKQITEGMDPHNGWVDVYPHKYKDSGASCCSSFGKHPFIKLNYQNESDDVSTVAHEYGHAMHSVLSYSHQPQVTAGYVPFIAEVASTCNEKLLSDYLIANAKTDEEKLYLLNDMVDRIRATIYRQALFADWELRVHEAYERGDSLTADYFNKLYADLIREYYGPEFTVGENDGIEWAYIPHLYYKFYVFSYTAGMSSGIAIADRIEKEGEPARDAYLKMLSSGCSKSPVDLLKMAGVDITKPQAMEAAAKCMDEALDQMEEILVKQGKIKK